ncbi:MAG: ATP-binding cassette domain-containing protein [Cyclobacteriaceae bacterium]|nr:ATP-binding cassette domain-containing protein [Cyclobacteriaceae bacterium]
MSFSSDPIVRVKQASIFQDNQTVLSDINFELEKGELAFIIGRTGSGKSSLLKTLYADLPLRLGDISIAGYNLNKLRAKDVPMLRRKLGIIFQDFQLFNDRTVAENLNFVMKATGWKDRSKMKKRLAEILIKVGLGAVDTKMPHQLSGGEQQRVVIARAIINEPLLLIADEPTGNLDPEVSDGIFELFLEINKSGTAILMATHDHTIIGNHPARILKCEQGKIKDSNLEQFDLSSQY